MLLQRVRVPSFLQPHNIPLCKCTTAFSSTHLLMGTLGCFCIWAIVNNEVMNIGVPKFFLIVVSGFLGYIARSSIAGSKGSSIFNFFKDIFFIWI